MPASYRTDMADNSNSSDALLSAAFSLYSNPGAYALLLGAGVSASSGIPTAWPLLMDLVRQVAALEGDSPEDPEAWYLARFAVAPTYQGVLEQLGPTPYERQRLLRSFFDRTEEDVEAGRKLPTPAHTAIARLVRAGAVRVILTLNFDHLIEEAIRKAGIEPTVIASPADIKGMAPLHTLECCVVHLHGDYLNPTSMRNTVQELGAYDPATQQLLERILQDYGLLVAGWSATYDPMLREAVAEHYSTRFTMTWIERSASSEEASRLRMLKRGAVVTADADTAFGHLADGIAALAARQSRNPLTIPVAVETAKRELAGRPVAIGLHDRLRQELEKLHNRPEFYVLNERDVDPYEELVGRVEEATRLPAALLATLAYWGRNETDSWWVGELSRLATGVDGSGAVKFLNLRVISGSMLFYAAGVAAVAAQRYDLLGQLFSVRRPHRLRGTYETLAASLDASASYENIAERDTRLYSNLVTVLTEALQIGAQPVEDAWQRFEMLRLSWAVTKHPNFVALRADHELMDFEYRSTAEAEERNPPPPSSGGNGQSAELRAAWENLDSVLGQIGRLAPIGKPHVLAGERNFRDDGGASPEARRLIDDLKFEGSANPLITNGLFGRSDDALLALRAVDAQLAALADRCIWEQLPPGGGFMPSEIWLDSGLPPTARS